MQAKDHWENVYSTKQTDAVSWFQPHADLSLDLIKATGVDREAGIIDVGGGASTLVDDLVADGYTDLAVLDLSAAALEAARKRMGPEADQVQWIVADITKAELGEYTFAEDGPLQCSGLPVMRYRPGELHDQFGEAFTLLKHQKEVHSTPSGTMQQFIYCYCRRS